MGTRLAALDVGTDVQATDIVLVQQGGVDKQVVVSELPIPMDSMSGLITSQDTDTDHDVAIAPGAVRSADDATNLRLAAVLTKRIDAAWAVGDDNGGIDTGSVAADTLYAIWLIKRPDTAVVDALFSASFSAPTMPTNYTKKRLIGAVITDGSDNILEYQQIGDDFVLAVGPQVESNSDNSWGTPVLKSIKVPPSCIAKLAFDLTLTAPSANAVVSASHINGYNTLKHSVGSNKIDDNSDYSTGGRWRADMQISSGQQFYYTIEGAGTSYLIVINLTSFRMVTRREP